MNARVDAIERFSLVEGGPLYRLYQGSGLLAAPVGLAHRRVIAMLALTWLPLLVMTLIGGTAFGGTKVPFLHDYEVYTKLLLALPLLVAAEPLVHRILGMVVKQFLERGIVAPEDQPRFQSIIDDSMRLRNSVLAEVLLIAYSTSFGYWFWREDFSLHLGTWYLASAGTSGEHLTAAGWWYAFVSLNVFRFVLMRWYWRLFIWYVFLFRVARLPLHLNALHPDRAAGLGFLGNSMRALAPVLVAQAIMMSGAVANHIVHEGAKLQAFRLDIAGAILFLLAVALVPLAFFSPRLHHAGVEGRRAYGQLAMRYVDGFRDKWMRGGTAPPEPLVGTSDIQSLADLANAHQVAAETEMFPVRMHAVIRLAVAIAVPFLPLALTIIPLEELIDHVVKRLF